MTDYERCVNNSLGYIFYRSLKPEDELDNLKNERDDLLVDVELHQLEIEECQRMLKERTNSEREEDVLESDIELHQLEIDAIMVRLGEIDVRTQYI